METMKFPFSDVPNTACFTCCHVLEENKPILYVSHDEDGYWQFLCGGNHKEEDVRVVSLASILRIDESVLRHSFGPLYIFSLFLPVYVLLTQENMKVKPVDCPLVDERYRVLKSNGRMKQEKRGGQ